MSKNSCLICSALIQLDLKSVNCLMITLRGVNKQ